ncbi:MAG: hypothetical protein KJ600_02075 [Nanoarchaeota archaeon]|nr:hypothetical protein [Nanoarchaeota archaeon]MBU1103323.1 hypothetical protein [Nanoarchaeota archaeon]
MKLGRHKGYNLASNIIFFLNIFIALMIVFGSWFLLETEFGRTVLSFAFAMLVISVVLKAVQWW